MLAIDGELILGDFFKTVELSFFSTIKARWLLQAYTV